MNITIFDASSGMVLRTATAPVGMAGLQITAAGEDWIDGHYADDQFYIDGYMPVPMGPKPSPHHVFNYPSRQWIDPRTPETEWVLVRTSRNQLLSASDWTQLPDVPLATKEAWATYRQALRDITLQVDPFSIVWPVTPAG